MTATWIAFVVLGLVFCIYVVVSIVRLASRARLLESITVDTYNVYISNNTKCTLWQFTDKALKRNKIALKRAINSKKRSGEEIRVVDYAFKTPVPKFMRVSDFYHHIKPKCESIQQWGYTLGHNIELHCRYYHTEGNTL